MNGKLKLYFSIMSFVQLMLRKFGIKFKKKILINCRVLFHFHHIKPVVALLAENDEIIIYILEAKEFKRSQIPRDLIGRTKSITPFLTKFVKFDLTISLDYYGPWIPHPGIHIFAPHGDGMKSNYSGNQQLSQFDVIFAMGHHMESLQKPFIKEGTEIKQIGFIINDQLYHDDKKCLNKIRFKIERPIVLYAPSWSDKPKMVMMNENLLQVLSNQQFFNVIFKPHPNFFIPEKCGGKDWNSVFSKLNENNMFLIKKSDVPIQAYMKQSDVLLSDYSSVVFEYLYCDKPIVLHTSQNVLDYYGGKSSFNEISQVSFQFDSVSEMIDVINQALEEPDKHAKLRQKMLHTKYFNIGSATQVAYNVIMEYINSSIYIKK